MNAGPSSYRSHVNDNKSQTGSRNLLDKTNHFIPKPGTKHLVPVSCRQLQKVYTGTSSYRSELVPVSCTDTPKALRSRRLVVRWKTVCEIIFSCIFRRFQSRFDICSCGQDHTRGYEVIQLYHRRHINLIKAG